MNENSDSRLIDKKLLDEYTRLNNELINLRRDLLQRNQELSMALKSVEIRNAELQQLVRAISHDLRQPLTSLTLDLHLVENLLPLDQAQKSVAVIHRIQRVTRRLASRLDDLLRFTRVGYESYVVERVDMESLVIECMEILQGLISEARAMISPIKLPSIIGCRTLLLQLVQNLIGNAIKFHRDIPPEITISASETNDAWQFIVEDNGIGIEHSEIDQLFNLFKTAHPNRDVPGNGIGLSICKKIVQLHGGRIWVESVYGKGSTFYFTISKQQNVAGRVPLP